MREILSKSLTLRGFIYSEFARTARDAEFLREVGAGISDGRIRYREGIMDGLDKALEAFIGMVDGAISPKLSYASECYLMTCDTSGPCAMAKSRHWPRL